MLSAARLPLAEDLTEQAPVTEWPVRLGLTAAVAALIALVVWAMWRNWRKRIVRQDWVRLPDGPPADFAAQQRFPARYVASAPAGAWLERIAAQGLGMPGRAEVQIGGTGVLIDREGERAIYLPASAIVDVESVRGIAQEVYERDGLVAITWRSGDAAVTTGLRMAGAQDHTAVLAQVQSMMGAEHRGEGKAGV